MPEKFLADEPLQMCACDGVGNTGSCPQPNNAGWFAEMQANAQQALDEYRAQQVQRAAAQPLATINGWTPPIIYDVTTDSRRVATQADVDRLERIARAYADLRSFIDRHLQRNEAF